MGIVFFPSDTEACGFYRMYMPAIYLNRLGIEAYISHSLAYKGERIFDYRPLHTKEILKRDMHRFGDMPIDRVLNNFRDIDVIVYHRQGNIDTVRHMAIMKNAGKRVYVEHDDWILDDSNPTVKVRKHFFNPQIRRCLEDMYHMADGIIVATEELSLRFQPYNNNVIVCSNSIDIGLWGDMIPIDEDSIGFAGSFSHRKDIEMIAGVLWGFRKDYPLKFMGMNPMLSNAKVHEWVDIGDYPKKLSGAFSVGVAPLKRCGFNACRSYIKWAEYSMAGIAVVAEDFGPYQMIRQGIDGYKCTGTTQWQDAITTLLNDKYKRIDMVNQARARIVSTYSIDKNIQKWVSVFSSRRQPIEQTYADRLSLSASLS